MVKEAARIVAEDSASMVNKSYQKVDNKLVVSNKRVLNVEQRPEKSDAARKSVCPWLVENTPVERSLSAEITQSMIALVMDVEPYQTVEAPVLPQTWSLLMRLMGANSQPVSIIPGLLVISMHGILARGGHEWDSEICLRTIDQLQQCANQ